MKERTRQGWIAKFKNAIRGIGCGVRGQSSFWVHLPVAVAVLAIAFFLNVTLVEFSVLLLCIGIVLAGELFNSGLEFLSRAVSTDNNDNIRDALDTASGAVLTLSIIAAIIGFLILWPPITRFF